MFLEQQTLENALNYAMFLENNFKSYLLFTIITVNAITHLEN